MTKRIRSSQVTRTLAYGALAAFTASGVALSGTHAEANAAPSKPTIHLPHISNIIKTAASNAASAAKSAASNAVQRVENAAEKAPNVLKGVKSPFQNDKIEDESNANRLRPDYFNLAGAARQLSGGLIPQSAVDIAHGKLPDKPAPAPSPPSGDQDNETSDTTGNSNREKGKDPIALAEASSTSSASGSGSSTSSQSAPSSHPIFSHTPLGVKKVI